MKKRALQIADFRHPYLYGPFERRFTGNPFYEARADIAWQCFLAVQGGGLLVILLLVFSGHWAGFLLLFAASLMWWAVAFGIHDVRVRKQVFVKKVLGKRVRCAYKRNGWSLLIVSNNAAVYWTTCAPVPLEEGDEATVVRWKVYCGESPTSDPTQCFEFVDIQACSEPRRAYGYAGQVILEDLWRALPRTVKAFDAADGDEAYRYDIPSPLPLR